jgi:hypothetical protein
MVAVAAQRKYTLTTVSVDPHTLFNRRLKTHTYIRLCPPSLALIHLLLLLLLLSFCVYVLLISYGA